MVGVCHPDTPLDWMTRRWSNGRGFNGGGGDEGDTPPPRFVKSTGNTSACLAQCNDFSTGDVIRIVADFEAGSVTFGKLAGGISSGGCGGDDDYDDGEVLPLPNMHPTMRQLGAEGGPLGPLSLWVCFDYNGDAVTLLRETQDIAAAVPAPEAVDAGVGAGLGGVAGAAVAVAAAAAAVASAAPPAAPAVSCAAAGGGDGSSSSSSSNDSSSSDDDGDGGGSGGGGGGADHGDAGGGTGGEGASSVERVQQQLGSIRLPT